MTNTAHPALMDELTKRFLDLEYPPLTYLEAINRTAAASTNQATIRGTGLLGSAAGNTTELPSVCTDFKGKSGQDLRDQINATNVALAQTPTFQPNPYVYRITIDGCPHAPENRRQTGFRVRGQAGIVTALHGLADCPAASINAEYSDGVLRGLALVAVDLDRDMALLTSPELEAETTIGLAAPPTDTVALDGLYAIGHPYGKTYQEPTTQITITYMMTLNRIIPEVFLTDALLARRSPDLQIRTLFAEAHFVPGHSGAPVLNGQDQVVGMVDGGLKEGDIGKSWLIPWADVVWQPLYDDAGRVQPAIKARWELLQQNNPELALSFLSTYSGEAADKAKALTYRGRLVDRANGRGIPNAEVHLIFEAMGEVRYSTTNESGFFEFAIAPNPARTEGLLWIHAETHEILERPIYDLDIVTRLGTIRLEALPPTPTPTVTVTPTPEPTATPQPMRQVQIIVTGYGFAPKNETNAARRKRFALSGARTMASSEFARWQAGEEVEAVRIVDLGELQTEKVRAEVLRTHIPGGNILEENYDDSTGEGEVIVEYVVEIPE